VLLDLLQDQLSALRGENVKLRRVVVERLPHVASKVFEKCTTEESMLLIDDEDELSDDDEEEGRTEHILGDGNGNSVTISNSNSRRMRKERDRQRRDRILGSFQVHLRPHPDEALANTVLQSNLDTKNAAAGIEGAITPIYNVPKQTARILMEPDFRLIEALIHSQQNFVLSDPSLPDNPIVYCSEGFCKLTGYKRQHILGRNCRFLQGPGTDQGAVDIIRKGVLEGCDISVCLLNYKADGSPFWNQFFVAALKDSAGEIINYVGVQCEVNTLPIEEIKDRVKRLPVPDL
jgi:PAS domain S-box-containing protein